MSSYSYGDYYNLVYSAYHEIPELEQNSQPGFNIKMPGSNKEVTFKR